MAGNLLDPNLSYGWTNQQAAGATNLYGSAGLGYGSVSGTSPQAMSGATAIIGQSTQAAPAAGFPSPNPAYSGNVNAPILFNPGFADSTSGWNSTAGSTSNLQPMVLTANTFPAAPATTGAATGVVNPSGLAATVTVTTSGAANISVAPFIIGGVGSATFTQVATLAAAGSVIVTVPPAGFIKVSANISSWTWVTNN